MSVCEEAVYIKTDILKACGQIMVRDRYTDRIYTNKVGDTMLSPVNTIRDLRMVILL